MEHSTCYFAKYFNQNWHIKFGYVVRISFVLNSTKIELETCTASQNCRQSEGLSNDCIFLKFHYSYGELQITRFTEFSSSTLGAPRMWGVLGGVGWQFEDFFSQLTNVNALLVTYFFSLLNKTEINESI